MCQTGHRSDKCLEQRTAPHAISLMHTQLEVKGLENEGLKEGLRELSRDLFAPKLPLRWDLSLTKIFTYLI